MLYEQFCRAFELLEDDGSNVLALSRRRLKLTPEAHGCLYVEVKDVSHSVPHEELPELTGFTHKQMDEASPLMATVGYVAPAMIPDDEVQKLFVNGIDYSPAPFVWWKIVADLAIHYGYAAGCQWRFFLEDPDKRPELAWALNQLTPMEEFFPYYLDRTMNKTGATGWDWLKGDIMAGLRRKKESD